MSEYLTPEMIGLREASRRTGVSYDRLRRGCLSGEFVHIKSGSKFLINFGKLCDVLNGEEVRSS